MGKIRVKSFGDQEQENKDKKLAEKRAEKKADQRAAKKEEQSPTKEPAQEQASEETKAEVVAEAPKKKKSQSNKEEKVRSENYKTKVVLIDPSTLYSVKDGLELLEKAHMAKFDETVELHINTNSTGISGQITLPHGSGKVTRVAIADDALIAEVEKGKINFDILVAHPTFMPKLAKVAKILGPRGLMPNPKTGTVSTEPEKVAKKYEGGAMNFKTEAKAPIIHLIVGKLSFGGEKLTQNIETAITGVKRGNILNVTLKSTMSPGIKIKA